MNTEEAIRAFENQKRELKKLVPLDMPEVFTTSQVEAFIKEQDSEEGPEFREFRESQYRLFKEIADLKKENIRLEECLRRRAREIDLRDAELDRRAEALNECHVRIRALWEANVASKVEITGLKVKLGILKDMHRRQAATIVNYQRREQPFAGLVSYSETDGLKCDIMLGEVYKVKL